MAHLCNKKCMKRLPCGNHDCDQPCHSGDCKEYTETSEFFLLFQLLLGGRDRGNLMVFSHPSAFSLGLGRKTSKHTI